MKIGFGLPVSGSWATPDNVARFAGLAEQRGYHALWTFQRLLVAVERRSPPNYLSVLDPLIALTFAAAGTRRIRLGVALAKFPFVSPAYLAKQAASLDVLSKGRLDLGVGPGLEAEEFVASNTTDADQDARGEEFLAALRTLLCDEVSRFEGAFYSIPPSRAAPKPVQRPGLPILLGGTDAAALRRAGALGDGWISGSATDLNQIAAQIAQVREAAAEAGKDPAKVRIVHRGPVQVGEGRPDAAGGRLRLTGDLQQVRDDALWLVEQGVDELFYDLNWDPLVADPALPADQAAARAERILDGLAPL